jgi:hypothetical protein
MTKSDYSEIRGRIEARYQQDVAALDRLRALFEEEGSEKMTPTATSSLPKRRGRPPKVLGNSIAKSDYRKFLVSAPNGSKDD